MIYADNAATTALEPDTFEVMKPFLTTEYGNASQPYSFARLPKKALKDARSMIAACINASPEEIYFTSGGTESDNWAIKGIINASSMGVVVTSQIEHHAILNSCKAVEKQGFHVKYLPVDNDGIVSFRALSVDFPENAKLVSIMLANNEIGSIEPVAELADLTHRFGAYFHTDAVQALGHIPVDVRALGIDMLSASGHKFNAPKGVGFLYIKNGVKISPYADGGSQEFDFRAGTENVAAIVGMAYALRKNCDRMMDVSKRLHRMENIFLSALDEAKIDYIRNGSANHIPGNINISIKGADGEMLLHRLDFKEIFISTGAACDSVNTKVSHVIQAIGVPSEYAKGTIRISFGALNKESDAAEVANAIITILK